MRIAAANFGLVFIFFSIVLFETSYSYDNDPAQYSMDGQSTGRRIHQYDPHIHFSYSIHAPIMTRDVDPVHTTGFNYIQSNTDRQINEDILQVLAHGLSEIGDGSSGALDDDIGQ